MIPWGTVTHRTHPVRLAGHLGRRELSFPFLPCRAPGLTDLDGDRCAPHAYPGTGGSRHLGAVEYTRDQPLQHC